MAVLAGSKLVDENDAREAMQFVASHTGYVIAVAEPILTQSSIRLSREYVTQT